MSLFDKDIHLPIERLYDECKDIVAHVIPMHMSHYNGQCDDMRRDIMFGLKSRNLLTSRFKTVIENSSDAGKINKVTVKHGEYVRRLPTYIVEFFYVEEITGNERLSESALRYGTPLAQFTVGINGIIYESIQ